MAAVQDIAQWWFMAALAWLFRPRHAKCAAARGAALRASVLRETDRASC
jgi:hypothetical protein